VSTPTATAPARTALTHTDAQSRAEAQGRSLRIGIDARAAAEVPAGRGRVVRELLRSLAARSEAHEYVLYAREAWIEADLDERFRWELLDARDPWWHMRAARAANGECDVFLSSNSYLTMRFLRIPAVPIVYDLATFEPGMSPNRRSQVIERLTLGPAVRHAAALVAISQATEQALIERYPRAQSRTIVAPLGVAACLNGANASQADATRLPSPGFVLAVGTLEPRKNLPRLVEAYASLDEQLQREHPLVVAGALGWGTNDTLLALRSLGERCQMLGYVSDEALAELYRRCALFCYPSLGEGFGLPVLEAMAAGAAVLTSNVSSLPEVGGEAVAYADPRSATDIAEQLRALLCDGTRRAQLAARGRVRAREFSWESFTETVLGALEGAAARSEVRTASPHEASPHEAATREAATREASPHEGATREAATREASPHEASTREAATREAATRG
jgi:glycosyltransferase involved in cell wall biosynthesis